MLDTAPPPAIIEVLSDLGGTLGERYVVTEWLRKNASLVCLSRGAGAGT